MPVLYSSIESYTKIEEIFSNSMERIVLLLPVFRLTEKFFEMLKTVSQRGVRITILFNTDELDTAEKSVISSIPHIEICYSADLAARCYFNENEMLITSMNLHDFDERKSGDLSIWFSRTDDSILYDKAFKLFKTLHESSVKLVSETAGNEISPIQPGTVCHGFCIRCAMPITFNKEKPYCRQCMNDRKHEKAEIAEENFCHLCARKSITSIISPLCSDCTSL